MSCVYISVCKKKIEHIVVCVRFNQLVDHCVASIYNEAHGGGGLRYVVLEWYVILNGF